jgi:peptidoglycan hydrolase-like protein with peptidoglycan-binding domain
MMDFLAANADALHVEAIFDYYPAPYGRGWKCDRAAWQVYSKKAFSGAPSGDWVHVEVSNAKADDAQYYIDTMKRLLGDPPVAVKPAPAKATPKAPPGKKPWYQVGSKGAGVKKVQEIVGAKPVDGSYGPKTAAAVKAWQAEHDQHVDGIWGPGSDKHSKNCDCKPAEPAPEPISSVKIGDDKKAAPKFTETIKRGSRGEHVKPVQEKVGAKQDGWFGPGTERRVMNWQEANGLKADGIVGPKTFAAMFG